MNIVYKYELRNKESEIDIPKNANILKVDVQRNIPVLWAIVNEDNFEHKVKRNFVRFMTGEKFSAMGLRWLGTFYIGDLVFHQFEKF